MVALYKLAYTRRGVALSSSVEPFVSEMKGVKFFIALDSSEKQKGGGRIPPPGDQRK